MKMNRILCKFLILVCALFLISCGNSQNTGPRDTNTDNNQSEKVTDIAVPANTYFMGRDKNQVIRGLEKLGFTNVSTVAIDDIDSDDKIKDGSVESVSIEGNENYSEGDSFPSDSLIVVTYHNIPKVGMPFSSSKTESIAYEEIVTSLSEAGFTNVSVEEVYDLDPDEVKEAFKNEVLLESLNSDFREGTLVPFDEHIRVVCHYPYAKYNVDIKINFIPNIFFNKYDVNVYLGDSKEDSMSHGEDKKLHFRVREGKQTIRFTDAEYKGAAGELTFNVSSDIEAEYEMFCYKDHIDLNEVFVDYKTELAEDEVKMQNSEAEYRNKNYNDVILQLKNSGFENINTVPLYDIYFGITEVGSVKSVSIAGKRDYRRGDVFKKNDVVTVTYHLSYEDDPEYIKEQERKKEEAKAKEAAQQAASTPESKPSSTPVPESSASASEAQKLDIDTFVKLQDYALKSVGDGGIRGHAFRVARTVYIDITQDGIANAVRVVMNSRDYTSWNSLTETLRVRSEDCKNDLDENGLNKYSCVVQLLNDEDEEYALATFTNGEITHDIVRGY